MKMTIYGEHPPQSQGFRCSNQACIRQVHRCIPILSHHFSHAIALDGGKLVYGQPACCAHLPQLLLCHVASGTIQQIHGFCHASPCRDEGNPNVFQRGDTASMRFLLRFIKYRAKRPGVHQYHNRNPCFRYFSSTASATFGSPYSGRCATSPPVLLLSIQPINSWRASYADSPSSASESEAVPCLPLLFCRCCRTSSAANDSAV